MKQKNTVTYCEWLFMGNPIEREMPYKEALKRYNAKVKALKSHQGIAVDASFVGIKKGKKWLKKHE